MFQHNFNSQMILWNKRHGKHTKSNSIISFFFSQKFCVERAPIDKHKYYKIEGILGDHTTTLHFH